MVSVSDYTEATIAAIATPPGAGGIGVIRISGVHSLSILERLFRPHRPIETFASHRMYYGWIVDPENGMKIDEVLAVYMQAPHTYTREDVVEIQCHGSYLVQQQILAQLTAAGARLAGPGEFTKRAFLKGRIDLTQAEAVLDLIQARTSAGLAMSTAQLQGRLNESLADIRDALIRIRAVVEVAIDFPDEDEDILKPAQLMEQLRSGVIQPLAELIDSAERGKIVRDGISVVIVGRPNVGKSSLLNTLLREERALVTPVPGTTRDTIEEYIDVKGIPVRIIDTAGIRDTSEMVEDMGIQRARAKLAEADLVLFLVDVAEPLRPEDRQLYESIKDASLLVILNKVDLASEQYDPLAYVREFPGQRMAAISAKFGTGIDVLEEAIFSKVTADTGLWDPGACVPNLRHKTALVNALGAANRVLAGLGSLTPDLLALDLQAALDLLGEIVGATTTEDVLDMIFAQFCIGK